MAVIPFEVKKTYKRCFKFLFCNPRDFNVAADVLQSQQLAAGDSLEGVAHAVKAKALPAFKRFFKVKAIGVFDNYFVFEKFSIHNIISIA